MIMQLMKERHSVRQYTSQPIEQEKRDVLCKLVREINESEGLNIQILFDEPSCFDSLLAHYGKFVGVNNYICLVGKKSPELDEKLGYFGEMLVLKAQELGLNTCWVAMSHGKSRAVINKGEKQVCLISLGYGATMGVAHKSKPIERVCNYSNDAPDWFVNGVNAALLAPTAINQQKFYFELMPDGSVNSKCGKGFYVKVDLGIAKYHFEKVSEVKVN